VRGADLDAERLGEGPPVLFVPGSVVGAELTWRHSPVFDAVCDRLAAALGAERATIEGKGHSVPETGEPYNRLLEGFLRSQERGSTG
jgi:hypothetical protein